jgi:hypothetical protein
MASNTKPASSAKGFLGGFDEDGFHCVHPQCSTGGSLAALRL